MRPARRARVVPALGGNAYLTGSSGRIRIPALTASGLPLPTRAKTSCRRQPQVNTVRVCADEPLPSAPLDTVRDQLSAEDPDPLAGQPGKTVVALHQLAPPVIRNWLPADWPAFAVGQRAVSANSAS